MLRLTEAELRALDARFAEWPGRVAQSPRYPDPRDRPRAVARAVAAFQPSPVARPSVISGYQLNFGLQVAGPGVQVRVSDRLPWPFVIKHVYVYGDSVLNETAECFILSATDNNTGGGVATTGKNIQEYQPISRHRTTVNGHEFYPNYLVNETSSFLKVVFNQQVAATRNAFVVISIQPQ